MSTLLNEEIKRIKSLFTEERLYGNLVDLITEDISPEEEVLIKRVTLRNPSNIPAKYSSDILIDDADITADGEVKRMGINIPIKINQVHITDKNEIKISAKAAGVLKTEELGKIKDSGSQYKWEPDPEIFPAFKDNATADQKAIFNAFINGITSDYNFGKTVLAAAQETTSVDGTTIINNWKSSSTPAEEVTEEVEHKGVFIPGTTDVKHTGEVTEESETGMKFEYTGPEFYGGDGTVHALANTVASKVGEQLRALYAAGTYVRVNLNKITYKTKTIECDEVKWPDPDESICINFKISVPFVKVEDKCQAFTSIEHGGSWGGNNADANTTINKSKVEKINLDGDEFDTSEIIKDENGKVTEYWFQWRNKGKQEADCGGTPFPTIVKPKEEKVKQEIGDGEPKEKEEIVNRNKPEHLNNIKAGQKNGVIYKGKDDLVKRGKKLVYKETDKAFTGIVYTEDGNGGLQKEVTYEKGRPSGNSTTYHPNGRVKIMIDNGKWKSYYPSGKLRVEGKLERNLESGVWKYYYENGQLAKETPYQSGEKHGIHKEWDKDGNQTVEELWKNNINKNRIYNPSPIYNKKYVN